MPDLREDRQGEHTFRCMPKTRHIRQSLLCSIVTKQVGNPISHDYTDTRAHPCNASEERSTTLHAVELTWGLHCGILDNAAQAFGIASNRMDGPE